MNHEQARKVVMRSLKYQSLFATSQVMSNGNYIGPGHIPLIMGVVGSGKTELVEDISQEIDLPYEPINFGENNDGVDVTGVPFPQTDAQGVEQTVWAPNSQIYKAIKGPTLLHLDDIDKAPPPAQNAVLAFIQKRRFRGHHLHKGSLIVMSGNRVDDDMYANELSESFRDRSKIVFLDLGVQSFTKWANKTELIHPIILGFVNFDSTYLHKIDEEEVRTVTPRNLRRASDELFHEPEKDWEEILEINLGTRFRNDCWAWYQIYRKVDVAHILQHGKPKNPPTGAAEVRKFNYAAVFAVSMELNKKGIKKSMTGIPDFVKNMEKEMRVAFLVQLKKEVRARIGETFEDTADLMMEQLVN
jgi:hypothetical protein